MKNIMFWLVAFILLSVIMNGFSPSARQNAAAPIAFSEFMDKAENNHIDAVTIVGNDIYGTYDNGNKFRTYAPFDPSMVETLRKLGVKIEAKPIDTSESTFWGIVISWFPMLLLIGVWIFFMRQASSGNNKAMSFGKSRAKLIENTKRVTFADVAGADESKQELEEIIDFLKDPQKFQRLGGKIPKGVLLVGPPGTGKTLLAKAVAGEANVPFFSISGSDFVEMFVGVGASRVRDMFAQAKKNAPCLLTEGDQNRGTTSYSPPPRGKRPHRVQSHPIAVTGEPDTSLRAAAAASGGCSGMYSRALPSPLFTGQRFSLQVPGCVTSSLHHDGNLDLLGLL